MTSEAGQTRVTSQSSRSRAFRSLADDLRTRSKLDIEKLITSRPDIVEPIPSDLGALAVNASGRNSVRMAIDSLDATQLSVLHFLVSQPTDAPLLDALSDSDDVQRVIRELWESCLLWGILPSQSDEVSGSSLRTLHVHGAVREILRDPYYGTLELDEPELEPAHDGGALQVVLGEHVAGSVSASFDASLGSADTQGAHHALEAVSMLEDLGDWFNAKQPVVRKAGGLGARELATAGEAMSVGEQRAAFWIELMASSGLVGVHDGSSRIFCLTRQWDEWLQVEYSQKWELVARSWILTRRDPGRVGTKDVNGETIPALSEDNSNPLLLVVKRLVMELIAELEVGSGPDLESLYRVVEHRLPRVSSAELHSLVDQVLAQSELLGITVNYQCTSLGKIICDPSLLESQAMAEHFPPSVDDVIAQNDMTLVVPGTPSAKLGQFLMMIASRESTGGAFVFRLTPDTLKRAVALGLEPEKMLEQLGSVSVTPLPQAMEYLIKDSAGGSESETFNVVRAERPLVRTAAKARLIESGDFESSDGNKAAYSVIGHPDDQGKSSLHRYQILAHALFATGQDGDSDLLSLKAPRGGVTRLAPSEVLSELNSLSDSGKPAWIGVVSDEGEESAHLVEVVDVTAGIVTGLDRTKSMMRSFPISRVAGVQIAIEEEK